MRSNLEKCNTCYHKYHKKWEAGICDYYDKCEDNAMYKRYTNADAIRQMSDEEIAGVLCGMTDCKTCCARHICETHCKPKRTGFEIWVAQEN